MYNQNFLDSMDRVNNIAKSMGYQNGVAWARKQKEDGRISEYIYEIFNDCHSLRNLMAHGYSADINITLQTMQKVQSLVETISNSSNKTAFGNTQEVGFNTRNEFEVQIGDYVVACGDSSRIFYRADLDEFFNVCVTFKVIDITKTSVILEDINNGELFDFDKLENCSKIHARNGLYVLRTNPARYDLHGTNFSRFDVPKNKPMHVIKEPTLGGENGDTSYVSLTLLKNYDYENSGKFNPSGAEKIYVKGYFAHIYCFDKTKNKPLFDPKKEGRGPYMANDGLIF